MAESSDIEQRIRRVGKKFESLIETTIRNAGREAAKAMIFNTPIKTGRARGNWVSFNGPDREVKSDPIKFDLVGATTAAEIARSTSGWKIKDGQIVVVNATRDPVTDFPYILSLNKGSSRQNPTGMLPFGKQAGLRELRKLGGKL